MWHVEGENGERVLNYRSTARPDYMLFIGNHSKDIEQIAPFPQLKEAVQSDPRLARAFLGTEGRGDVGWFLLFSYSLPIISGLLRALDEGKQLEVEIGARISVLDDFLKKDTLRVRLYAPLLNLTSSSENVELADGVSVCALPDGKLEEYINTIAFFSGGPNPHDLRNLNFQLEGAAEVPRLNPYLPVNESDFFPKCQSLLRAFRLYRPGAVRFAFFGGSSKGLLGLGSTWMNLPRFERAFGEEYQIAAADGPAIADLYSRLKQLEKDRRFQLAMGRFMGAYEKPFGGDRLIDYWIALESLLMPEESASELSYRASLRGACFASEGHDRVAVFAHLRDSYRVRSMFVHGIPGEVDGEIVVRTEGYLRKILLRCLHLGMTRKKEMLDSLVLGQGKP